jgi:putative endonuclease
MGELDLVMRHRRTIVFVEVKTRSSGDFGGAAQAVDRAKSRRLARVASAYLSRFSLWDRPTRFDVVTFERSRRFPGWRARHLRNTIRPDLGRSV